MDAKTRKPIRAINFKHWENNTKDTLQICIGSEASIAKAKAFLEEEYKIYFIRDFMKSTESGYSLSKFHYESVLSHEFLSGQDNDFKLLKYQSYVDYEDNDFYTPPVVLTLAELRNIQSKIFLNEGQERVRFLLTGKLPEKLITEIGRELIRFRVKSAEIVKFVGKYSQRRLEVLHSFDSILDIPEEMEDMLPPAPSEEVVTLPMDIPFEWSDYPFPKYSKEGDCYGGIAHIDNISYVLKKYGITIRYNVISKSDELILNDGHVHLIDNRKAESIEIVKSLCEMNNYPISRVEHQLLALSNANPYNPVIEYCTVNDWDGEDRVSKVLDTVIVDDELNDWRDTIVVKFMIAAICAAINDEKKRYKFKTVLTFQGQQGIGKTPWIKILTGEMSDYFLEGHLLNPEQKDSCITALTHWITELGELDATTKKSDVAAQKAFIDRSEDSIRLPYARTNSQWARRTVFFGTVNPSSFLIDNTGNDRFWCLPVKDLLLDDLEKINMQQMWAQIYQYTCEQLSEGNREPWQLTKEEHAFQRTINESFRSLTAIEEAIIDTFEPIKDRPRQWQANLSDILTAIGHPYATDKERASAKVWIEKLFGSQKPYAGKRGWAIPSIPGLNEHDHSVLKMKKRGS